MPCHKFSWPSTSSLPRDFPPLRPPPRDCHLQTPAIRWVIFLLFPKYHYRQPNLIVGTVNFILHQARVVRSHQCVCPSVPHELSWDTMVAGTLSLPQPKPIFVCRELVYLACWRLQVLYEICSVFGLAVIRSSGRGQKCRGGKLVRSLRICATDTRPYVDY